MHMEEVEVVTLGDLVHAGGEGFGVRRVLKEGIRRDLDLVVVDAGCAGVEPDRVRVGDEVDVVAAGGEFEAEFGCENAAPTIGGVTRDPNPQRVSSSG